MKARSLSDFLTEHAAALLAEMDRRTPPRVSAPGRLPPLLRPPLGKQDLAISAAAHALEEHRGAVVVGEMGTGKTYVAAAVASLTARRTVVLCPPHLVEKWREEIRATVPGARVEVAERVADLQALEKDPPEAPFFLVLNRERAKLEAPLVNAGVVARGGVARCRECGAALEDRNNTPIPAERIKKLQRPVCPACGAPLYAPDPNKVRRKDGSVRYPLARYISRRMRGFFDLLIVDEAHEYKAADSAQGLVAGGLAQATGRTLVLTGTLFGGYASTLFYLLWRFLPPFRRHFGYQEVKEFVLRYGATDKIQLIPNDERGRSSRRGEVRVSTREAPSVSPLLLHFILPYTVFLKLEDVAEKLPPYQEEVRTVKPSARQLKWYREVVDWFTSQNLRRNPELLGAYFHASVYGPDTPFYEREYESENGLQTFPPLEADDPLPKEEALVELVRQERARGRAVLVFVQNTHTHDLTARLVDRLSAADLRARALHSHTTSARTREAWIRRAVGEGLDALVLHPRLVQTGLDLIDFPTLVFFQPEASVYVLRQASRRSWRVGQERPVRVVHLAYEHTAQLRLLELLAQKARVSLALEGHLLNEGLSALASDGAELSLAQALYEKTAATLRAGEIRIASAGLERFAGTRPEPQPLPTVAELAKKGARLPRRAPGPETQVLFPEVLLRG